MVLETVVLPRLTELARETCERCISRWKTRHKLEAQTTTVNNSIVPAEHAASRVHLALRSEHFRAMLYGGMRESEAGTEIEIKDVSHSVFLKLLEYLYTDDLSDVTADQALQLLVASEQYLLGRLKTLCEEAIRKSITVDSVCTIFLLAHKHNAEGLKEIALDFVLDHMEGVKSTPGFLELKQEPDLLMEIILRQAS